MIKKNIIPLCFMFSIPILNVFYGILNNGDGKVYNLTTALDTIIPFIKIFIVPYMIWYPFILATMIYLCVYDKKTYFRILISLDIGLITCYAVYVLFQTTVPRPELLGDNFITKFITLVYRADAPYNCFPSIHVLTSYLMIKGICRSSVKSIRNTSIVCFFSVLIIISTLLVKQHVILDAVSGILVGEVIFQMVFRFNREKFCIWVKKQCAFLTMKKKLET